MGTRADFYIGRGKEAKWLGSIGWDGYPSGMEDDLLQAKTEDQFLAAFQAHVATRDDFTAPERGWPWPWKDSRTTDYAYAFDGGQVWASGFGRQWFEADGDEPEDDGPRDAVFPDMSKLENVAMDSNRSGLIVVGF